MDILDPCSQQDPCPPFDHSDLLLQIAPDLLSCHYRGTRIDRLAQVLRTGIDVEPPDSFFFVADSFNKALEYGGWPKVILFLDPSFLQNTYCEIPSSTPAEEVERLRIQYPTILPSVDGASLWLSRLPPGDRRIATPYESDYARWIDGNQLAALKGIIIFSCGTGEESRIIADYAKQLHPTAVR